MEYLLLVLDGAADVQVAGSTWHLAAADYTFLPADTPWTVMPDAAARLLVFEKRYQALPHGKRPEPFRRALADVPALPFLGDEGALLQTLLPEGVEFDWGINVFEFVPGATLPQVESHFMEHGLYLLEGQGVYRLGEHWYPVQGGDAIWMAPYLLQWFAATGKAPTRYIYYKEMNREPRR
jgi:(S)-ureidoglycine aminohydrolase